MIRADGLTKRYGAVPVLDHASFEVPTGNKAALVGPNGAGKSTLLAVLSTLVTPSAGSATVGEHTLESGSALRAQLGVLSHRPMLYEELSPLENLRFFARLYRVRNAAPRIEELLRAVGLWHRRDEQTAVLSRGYHQRLALARCVVHQPTVLLLDEPETGLDVAGLELLDELLLQAPGLTVLAATHMRNRIGSWADAAIELDRGRVVAGGLEDAAAAASPGRASAQSATPVRP